SLLTRGWRLFQFIRRSKNKTGCPRSDHPVYLEIRRQILGLDRYSTPFTCTDAKALLKRGNKDLAITDFTFDTFSSTCAGYYGIYCCFNKLVINGVLNSHTWSKVGKHSLSAIELFPLLYSVAGNSSYCDPSDHGVYQGLMYFFQLVFTYYSCY